MAYIPGISGPEASEVWVFTSIDGFQRPVMMQQEGSDFAAYFMAAPGPLRFAFQVGEQIFCSRTAPQVLLREVPLRAAGGGEGDDRGDSWRLGMLQAHQCACRACQRAVHMSDITLCKMRKANDSAKMY